MKQMILYWWNIVDDQSYGKYGERNGIIYNTKVLKSTLCDYSDAYVSVKGIITITAASETQVTFRNCAAFI